jgi:hypothetical protein
MDAQLLADMNTQAGAWHYGEELQEAAVAKAERTVTEELEQRHLSASELGVRGKPRWEKRG